MNNLNETGYESPQIQVIEIEVEKGFAISQTGGSGESGNWQW